MSGADQAVLDRAFAAIEAAAIERRRCPGIKNGLPSGITTALAHAGRIRIDVSTHNWRQATILSGPYAGRSTAPNPLRRWSIYLTIDTSGTWRKGVLISPRRM